MHRILLFAALAVTASAASAADVKFASGQATVPLPNDYRVSHDGDTLTAKFGAKGDHKLELTLLGNLSRKGEPDLAAQFVIDQGKKAGKEVSRATNRAVLMESGGDHQEGQQSFRVVHWQIGAGNCVFTMTVTAPLPLSSELDVFLGGPLNDIVNRVGCVS